MAPPRRDTSKENSRSPVRSQNRSPSFAIWAFAERLQKARTRTSSSVPATSRVDASAASGKKLTRLPAASPEGREGHFLGPQSKTLSKHRHHLHHAAAQHPDERDSCSGRAGPPDSAYKANSPPPVSSPKPLAVSTVSRRRPGQRRSMRAISQSAETPGVCTAPPKARVEWGHT